MIYVYPSLQEVDIKIPPQRREDRFCAGFNHGLRGGQLDRVEYFRLSFRLGVRAAKLFLREMRRHQGILEFPSWPKLRLKALF